MIRAFVAIALPEQVRQRLLELGGRLRALGLSGSFPRAESLHLTLKFLGEVQEQSVTGIGEVMERVCRDIPPFELEVRGLGVFPHPAKPRVVWIGVSDCESLSLLHSGLEDGFQSLGFPREPRSFQPHLTMVRLKSSENLRKLTAYLDEAGRDEEAGTFEVAAIHLFRSELRPDGARYSRLRSAALEGGI